MLADGRRSGPDLARQPRPERNHHVGHKAKQCVEECAACHALCIETFTHSLADGEAREDAHLRLLLDCAEMCQTAAHFLLRESDLHAYTCRLCAAICRQCATKCERFRHDPLMDACAQSCRRCAAACEGLSRSAMAA